MGTIEEAEKTIAFHFTVSKPNVGEGTKYEELTRLEQALLVIYKDWLRLRGR